jgi:hypothetical protein
LPPPHVASVVTFFVGAGAAEDVPVPEHVPNADWHPVPQYADVDPHQLFFEQQLPKLEPWQVKPLVPPHVASVETFFAGEGAAEAEGSVELTTEDELVPVQVPKPGWHPVPQ